MAPIPIHPKKLKTRGYNQAEIISKVVADILNIQHQPDLLLRKNKISTQTKKSRSDRNLIDSNPFQLNKSLNERTHILLIDDIITTGSTIEAAAHVLLNQNYKVSIASIGYTLTN